MEEELKINRRDLINSSALAGLALAFGFLGINNSAKGQTKQSGANELIDIPARKKFIEQQLSAPKYKQIDFHPLLEKITKESMEIFQIENDLLQKIKSDNLIPAIETYLKPSTNEDFRFNPNNLEDLLDQASNLLDRGIKDRTEWDNLSIRLFYLEIEINQFVELDKIHQQEIFKGYYNQQLDEKLSQLNIERLNRETFEQIATVFSDMFNKLWNDDKIRAIIGQKKSLAISGIWASGPTGPTTQAVTMADQATFNIEEFNMAVEKVYNYLQNTNILNSEDQSRLKEKLLKKQVNWEEADREFRLMRTDIERKYEYLKLLAFKSEDGVLNLRKRMEPLKIRFKNDFNEASKRLEAASLGLNTVFGYPNSLPEFKGQIDYFDQCILWAREAINWLIRTTQNDQSFVTTISLKQLFDKTNKLKLEDAINEGYLKFSISEDAFFSKHRIVRLKGSSIFIQLSKKKGSKNYSLASYQGIIQCEIGVPTKSYYRYENGDTKDYDQSYIPKVTLNRIATRDFIRQPDIVGTTLFNNLSPFGEWTLYFPQIENETITKDIKIEDIQMDLFITARRKR